MAEVTTTRQEVVYTVTLNQHEMETVYSIIANTNTHDVYEEMEYRGFKVDRNLDTPFDLYESFRDALGIKEG